MTAAELKMKSKLIERDSKKQGKVYYVHLEYYDENGNLHRPDLKTGYTVTPPKTYKLGLKMYKAEVDEKRKQIEAEYTSKLLSAAEIRERPEAAAEKIFFCDWMLKWFEDAKRDVIGTSKNGKPYAESTLNRYGSIVNNIVVPYFKAEGHHYTLHEIDSHILQTFFNDSITEDRTAKTVKHWHACISRALSYAVYNDLIRHNPASNSFQHSIDTGFEPTAFNEAQLHKMASLVIGTWLEVPVWFGARFGLRRSEIIGIKWSMIDFDSGVLKIYGKYIDVDRYGRNPHYETTMKTKSSRRVIPLTASDVDYLKRLKEIQESRQTQPNYNKEFVDFVCVKENGELIKNNYLTEAFPKLCEKNNLPRLRWHDLRGTVVSTLISNGASAEAVARLLGHDKPTMTITHYYTLHDEQKRQLTAIMGTVIDTGKPIAEKDFTANSRQKNSRSKLALASCSN